MFSKNKLFIVVLFFLGSFYYWGQSMFSKLGIMKRQGIPYLYKLEKLAQFLIVIFTILDSFSKTVEQA